MRSTSTKDSDRNDSSYPNGLHYFFQNGLHYFFQVVYTVFDWYLNIQVLVIKI
jgi:hypothetical protein